MGGLTKEKGVDIIKNKSIATIAEEIRQYPHQAKTLYHVQHHIKDAKDAKKTIESVQAYPPPLHLEKLTTPSR